VAASSQTACVGCKLRLFHTSLSFNALARGWTLSNFWMSFFIPKTRVLGLSVGENFGIYSLRRFHSMPACDRQTDETDGRTSQRWLVGLQGLLTPCKNPPRNMEVMVQNKAARFLWPTLYIKLIRFSPTIAVGFGLPLQFLVLNCEVSATGATVPATIPAQCCAIPFTLKGKVYYGCTDNGRGVGCFYGNRKWRLCQQPAGKQSKQTNIYRHRSRIQ